MEEEAEGEKSTSRKLIISKACSSEILNNPLSIFVHPDLTSFVVV